MSQAHRLCQNAHLRWSTRNVFSDVIDFKGVHLAAITIQNLDDTVKQQLRERAARNSRSMEAAARAALIDYVAHEESLIEYDLATRIRERLAELDAFVAFELPDRSMDMPRSPTSDE